MFRPYRFTNLLLIMIVVLAFSVTYAAATDSNWSYCAPPSPTCTNGPTQWGGTCQSGKSQSPIDIMQPKPTKLPKIEFSYHKTSVHVVNNGHTIEASYGEGSASNTITLDGVVYTLVNFHFHVPSEHSLKNKSYPMELHLVHKSKEGQLAVVGVLLTEGTENPLFGEVLKNAPAQGGSSPAIEVNADQLLPGDHNFDDIPYYTYSGSLTTPPCSEGVTWLVLTRTKSVSEKQVKAFQGFYPANARPVQNLNGRTVKESKHE